jgi:hypothetical protein
MHFARRSPQMYAELQAGSGGVALVRLRRVSLHIAMAALRTYRDAEPSFHTAVRRSGSSRGGRADDAPSHCLTNAVRQVNSAPGETVSIVGVAYLQLARLAGRP